MRTAPKTEARAPRRRGAAIAALLTAGIAAGLALAGGTPAFAESADGADVTWGVRTADNDRGENRENYSYDVEPGETLDDAIIIANHDAVPIVLDVYAADAFTTVSGQLDVETRDVSPRELGAWAVPTADRVTVQPGEAVEVPFTITVPANAIPGDHAGGILTALADADVENGLTVDRRLGIRIHVRVAGDLAPALAIDDLRVDYAGELNPFATGAATVSYTVRNAGNTRLSAAQDVTLTGPFGVLPVSAAHMADVPELLPGETWAVETEVEGVVPAFVLTAAVALDPAAPTETKPAPKPVEETASTAAIPWTVLLIVLLLAAAIVTRVVVGRRRRRQRKAREEARVQEAVDRALREREAQTGTDEPTPTPTPTPTPAPETESESEPEPEPEPEPAART